MYFTLPRLLSMEPTVDDVLLKTLERESKCCRGDSSTYQDSQNDTFTIFSSLKSKTYFLRRIIQRPPNIFIALLSSMEVL